MPFRIVRNDITKMKVDAIVNTANEAPIYSFGVDTAVYHAAGKEKLLAARREIGYLEEGDVAITPGFKLPAKHIIHAVSPYYEEGREGIEELLRSCYRKSLALAKKHNCKSLAFPLISTGSFNYPVEEGMRIAMDEINAFLMHDSMLVYLVVFDAEATELGMSLYPDLESYIDHNYVCKKSEEEYGYPPMAPTMSVVAEKACYGVKEDYIVNEQALDERMRHLTDTFQEYLFYLIKLKDLKYVDVYTNSLITKQTASKIKKNKYYHPDKSTAMRLCVGLGLNLDETKDLLARAGYALSSCDKRDVIFSFFIENEIYDIYEIDIALEKYDLPCFIN